MIGWLTKHRWGPIGVDIGARSIKLMQCSHDAQQVLALAQGELPQAAQASPELRLAAMAEVLGKLRDSRPFRGRDAVLCLGASHLFVQNLRVPKTTQEALPAVVAREAAGRLPFNASEAEIRFLEAGEVRQGETVKREVIVLACQRGVLQNLLEAAEAVGLRPVAIDVEAQAMVRCFARQFRREEDQHQSRMFLRIGSQDTVVVIAQGQTIRFAKYLELGGKHFDDAVARLLKMKPSDAALLRRQGERRSDRQDPEVARTLAEAMHPVLERLVSELSLCVRYYSVTFRGQPLERVLVSGGEAHEDLVAELGRRLDLRCELANPLRSFAQAPSQPRPAAWDIAAGLALWTAT
jgi:type IV pilus assembly protein PilM